MREALKQAVYKAIFVECKLPHKESGLNKSCLSTQNDICFNNNNPVNVSQIIYNGIVEFAINEYEIDYDNLELEQRKAIINKIRYNPNDSDTTKLRYGFYGEVLLDLILRCFMKTNVLIARSFFYSPLENSEPKGFDVFHLVERDGILDLWFGEAKFYMAYKASITAVLEKIIVSLSDSYVNKNLIALIDWKDRFSTHSIRLDALLARWEANPDINLAQEMQENNIRLTYPIFIAYEKTASDAYHHSLKKCIDHIAAEFVRLGISIPVNFDYRLFFIFLPLSEVKKIKESVIGWIESKEPLI